MPDAMKKRSLPKRFQVQTFIPSALSRCNYIRQKYEKYGTHSQKNLHKSKQIETIILDVENFLTQTRKLNKTKRRPDKCQSAKIC